MLQDWSMPNKSAAVMNLWCCLMLNRVAGLTDSRGRRDTGLPAIHTQCSHDSCVHQPKLNQLMGHCWASNGASAQRAALHAGGRDGSTWQHLHRQTPGEGVQVCHHGHRHTQRADSWSQDHIHTKQLTYSACCRRQSTPRSSGVQPQYACPVLLHAIEARLNCPA